MLWSSVLTDTGATGQSVKIWVSQLNMYKIILPVSLSLHLFIVVFLSQDLDKQVFGR